MTLETVLRQTLEHNSDIRRSASAREISRGRLLEAGGLFATRLNVAVGGAAEESDVLEGGTRLLPSDATSTAHYSLSLHRRLRMGISLESQVAVERSGPSAISPAAHSAAEVRMGVHVPLWRDWSGEASAAAERSMRAEYGAETMAFRHAAAGAVRDAALAYWSYLATVQVLQVAVSAEARAERMVEDVRTMVEAQERPAADLNQLLASRAAERVSRIVAERAVLNARRSVGLAMGMNPDQILTLPAPATPFPEEQLFTPDSAMMSEWVEIALQHRADLGAQRERIRAADELVRGARSELKPDLQLTAMLGYVNVSQASGLQAFIAPLHEQIPGINATFELEFSFPAGNAEAEGLALQNRARLEQEQVTAEDLRRRIVTGVQVAAAALDYSLQALDQSAQAVMLQKQTVEDERSKYSLGASTLVDVLLAANALTAAELTLVSTRLSYAQALADLRFVTGTLLIPDARRIEVDTAALLEPM